jgi:hypothetical protein
MVALSNCSGSLVRLTTSRDSDRALVLTNGHCLGGGFLSAGQVVVAQPSTRTFSLLSADGRGTVERLSVTEVVYATMTRTDMALYRVPATYAEIEARTGVRELVLANHRASIGDGVHVPSGY